jgi:hypothetical protein
MDDLEQRLLRLEKQARWYRLGFAGLLLVVVAAVTIAAAPQSKVGDFDTVTAKQLKIVDSNGLIQVRIWKSLFGASVDLFGEGRDETTDVASKPKSRLVNATSPDISLHAGRSNLLHPELLIRSQSGESQVVLSTDNFGGSLEVTNKTGEEIVQVYADEYGNGIVWAGNRKGKGRSLQPGPQ